MDVLLEDAGRPAACEPLTCTRDLEDVPVAGLTFAAAREREVAAAGGRVVATPAGAHVRVAPGVWPDAADLGALRQQAAGSLVDADGAVLAAWCDAQGAPLPGPAQPAANSLRIRYAWDFLELNARLLRRVQPPAVPPQWPGVTVDGILIVGAGTRVLPGVYVEGIVVIGRNGKIGPNCYLRGPTWMGDDVRVGQAVEIKASLLMDGVHASHLSYIGDSVVGAHCNFGAGTLTANFRHDGKNHRSLVAGELVDTGRRKFGAIFGDHVHTGIHTSIYPGRKLWPHSSTRPGEVVQRDLSA